MPDDLPPLPDATWKRTSGKSGPRDGEWFVILRGIGGKQIVDTRIAYEAHQLIWKHGQHSGDVIAVKPAE